MTMQLGIMFFGLAAIALTHSCGAARLFARSHTSVVFDGDHTENHTIRRTIRCKPNKR